MARAPDFGSFAPARIACWQAAAAFAARRHRHQMRKDQATPYFAHVTRVAMIVSTVFGCDDPVVLCAAFLHDTIEDTTTDYEDLREAFGPQVATCVAALTKNMAMADAPRERDYHDRLAAGPWQSRLVKLADVYDNVSDLPMFPAAKRAGQRAKSRARAREALRISKDDARHPAHGPLFTVARRAVEQLLADS